MKQLFLSLAILFAFATNAFCQEKTFSLKSPDGQVEVVIDLEGGATYRVLYYGEEVLAPSHIALNLTDGTVYNGSDKLKNAKHQSINAVRQTPFTRARSMQDESNELQLTFANYQIVFRAYDNGVAYRFVTLKKKPIEIAKEVAEFSFTDDYLALTPYVSYYEEGKSSIQDQFQSSFESQYTPVTISNFDPKRISFLPIYIDLKEKGKAIITETALIDYPGLYLINQTHMTTLTAIQAPYPKDVHQGGHNNLQLIVDSTEPYVAKIAAPRTLPWRVLMLGKEDKDLANNDLTYILAEPSRVADTSWIKPGKVAWDWWNDWNIKGVDFPAGVNNDTYKYYIDFASKNGIEYVILDEGWATTGKADLMDIVPEINLEEIIDYAKNRNVGIILWAGYYALDRDLEGNIKHFADMGVKGFKIDFMDRDDQIVSDFYLRAATLCAKYHLVCDFHGAFKPAGFNLTFPNVLNFEGVFGLEQMKWVDPEVDQMEYDCCLPFIRQTAGPMDYTQGAMHNATRRSYHPNYTQPVSQGTRCHQLALYIVLESPLNMLCDSPTNYMNEPECTSLIASIPTTWDETIVVDGEVGKYVVTARRKGTKWYIAGITNWEARDITLKLPPIIDVLRPATIYKDGINAHRNAEDYKMDSIDLSQEPTIHLAPGGGFLIETN